MFGCAFLPGYHRSSQAPDSIGYISAAQASRPEVGDSDLRGEIANLTIQEAVLCCGGIWTGKKWRPVQLFIRF
jgi:hypothetical protein